MKDATTFVEINCERMIKNPARVFKIFLSIPAGQERMNVMKEYNEWVRAQ